jgi:hypothetical protein
MFLFLLLIGSLFILSLRYFLSLFVFLPETSSGFTYYTVQIIIIIIIIIIFILSIDAIVQSDMSNLCK